MKTRILFSPLIVLVLAGLQSCKPTENTTGGTGGNTDSKQNLQEVKVEYDADSAYAFVAKQVSFGPRVPGTTAHGRCVDYLTEKLNSYCDTAFVQEGGIQTVTGKNVDIRNVIGVINPKSSYRLLLAAHFDTRPQADEDPNRPTEAADGANDGASGVGVLLELARQLQSVAPKIGIDIIFFDAEDMGERGGAPQTWCLGSQYWGSHTHVPNYVAQDAVLLDMVGAKDAVFAYEINSVHVNQNLVHELWRTGQNLGYARHFLNIMGQNVIDDHQFVQQLTGIPMIDIIEHDVERRSFGAYWHTHADNMDVIDKKTLKAVGHTVLHWVATRDQKHGNRSL
ncbi:MAG: M28 family peptidase [Flavobacteriales bacterium]|nr:M28 family peptidase [Flavobacteriales bacterium]